MNHKGNVALRSRVADVVAEYKASPRDQKSTVLRQLILKWKGSTSPPGRFLKRAPDGGKGWCVLSDAEAVTLVQKMVLRKLTADDGSEHDGATESKPEAKPPPPPSIPPPPPADQGAAETLLGLSSLAAREGVGI
jgi:hypothetical protein